MTRIISHIIYRSSAAARALVRLFIILCLMSHVSCLMSQEERSLTREGNKLFDKQKYPDAEASYKKALEKKSNFPEAIFNLGDAMYKQGRYDDAAKQFELAAKFLTDTIKKAESYHNMGNCSLEKKEWEDAVKAYKLALRLNPRDRDTKYNLAYANAKLKDNNQNQKKNNKQNKDNKDDKKDQDKKNQQDNDKQGGNDKQDQKPKKSNGKELTKEQAEKLLEALKAEEQKTQEKMQKKTARPQDVKNEKDW
jgi:Ca-activated chloride channel family protein